MSFRILAVALLFTATTAATASADPAAWSKSTMASAPTYFPAGGAAMVVGVGDSAKPVAAALLAALQSSDALETASDARSLGKVDELSDDQIVKRAFVGPIKRVAIVRVFPAGGSVKAVVTVYAAQGQVASAFTLSPGKNLADNPNPKEATGGVARDEIQSVESTTATTGGGATAGEGEITYQRNQVGVLTGYGVVALENVTFFKNGRMISDTPALYDALGMGDKATTYRHDAAGHNKWAVRGAIMTSLGLTAVTGFALWAVIAGNSTTYNPNGTTTTGDATIPWALTLASAGLTVVGIYEWVSHPAPSALTADEAVSLVDAHNARHKHTASSLHFTPTMTPRGSGLLLSGSF